MTGPTRYFYDLEFDEQGVDIVLISLAVVCEDGREFYRVSSEWDPRRVIPWVRENVLPQLPDPGTWVPRAVIRDELHAFLTAAGQPELWAWYGAYDHVALCQLWGGMPALPPELPRFTLDVRQLWHHLGEPPLPRQPGSLHDALADARHVRTRFEALHEPAYRLGLRL